MSALPVASTQSALSIAELHAYYGESHILHGVSIDVKRGELVTLLGRLRARAASVCAIHLWTKSWRSRPFCAGR